MCDYAKDVMWTDITNAVAIGNMRPGDFLSIGVGDRYVIDIFAYRAADPEERPVLYDYEIKRDGARAKSFVVKGHGLVHGLVHRASLVSLKAVYASLAMTAFDRE